MKNKELIRIKSSCSLPGYRDLLFCLELSINNQLNDEDEDLVKAIIARAKISTPLSDTRQSTANPNRIETNIKY